MTRKYEVLVLTKVFVEATSVQDALIVAEYVVANEPKRIYRVRGELAREMTEDEWHAYVESL